MSANKPRKAGQRVYQKPKLRLVPSPEQPAPVPDPETKELLDDIKRRDRARRGGIRIEPDGKDAA